jgi:FtsH-binding integral membrane protein
MNIILLLTFIGIISLYKIYVNSNKNISANLILENVYIHILLGLIISSITALTIDKHTNVIKKIDSYSGLIGSFILSMISLFMVMTAGNNKFLQYFGFVVFMLSIGILIHPYVTLLKYNGKGVKIFLTLIAIIGILSLIAYKLPNMFIGWGTYLMFGLMSLIIIEIIDLIFGSHEGIRSRSKLYGWVGIILFSGFILYDSQRLLEKANVGQILSEQITSKDVNYPALSLSLYLDVLNLFSSLTNVTS